MYNYNIIEKESQPESSTSGSAAASRYADVLMRDAYEKKTQGAYQAAASIFQEILKRFSVTLEDPEKSVLHSELGSIFFWLGDYEAARLHCQRSVGFSENEDAYVTLGKIAAAQFQFPEARMYFSKVDKENPWRHLGLCLVALKIRDSSAAGRFLADAQPYISHTDPEYQVFAAYVELLRGDAKDAANRSRALISKCEHDPFLLGLIAEILMTAGNYGEARAVAEKIQVRCPENDHSYAILAHAAYAEGLFSVAEKHAEQALRGNPRNAYARTVLMKLATRSGSYSLAESIGLEILRESPEYSLAHANLGDVYFNQGRYELAETEYEQTFDLMNADTKGARLRQGRMKFIRKEYEDAAKILEKLIESHHTYYDDAMCDLVLCYDQLSLEEKKAEVLDKMELRRSFYNRTEKILQNLL